MLVVAPVILKIEQGFSLLTSKDFFGEQWWIYHTGRYLEDRILQVKLNPLHPSNTLVTSEPEVSPNVTLETSLEISFD